MSTEELLTELEDCDRIIYESGNDYRDDIYARISEIEQELKGRTLTSKQAELANLPEHW